MFNVVDSFYAGKISTQALAALALSFPVFLGIIAVSSGLSRGSSALISNAIGAGDKDRQRRFIAQSLSIGLLVSILVTTAGMFVTRPVFQVLGAEGEYLELAMAYMIPVFLGAIFFCPHQSLQRDLSGNRRQPYLRKGIGGRFLFESSVGSLVPIWWLGPTRDGDRRYRLGDGCNSVRWKRVDVDRGWQERAG